MKAVVCFSGGLDSTTLLYKAIAEHGPKEVAAISFHYQQRHERELHSAQEIAFDLAIPHTIVGLNSVSPDGEIFDEGLAIFKGSSQSDMTVEVPEGHYEDPTMRLTFVPNRNMVMLSMAAAYAISLKAPYVYFAAHAGDHAIYCDCRPEFVEAMNQVLAIANYEPITLLAPFIHISKADIVRLGAELKVPFEETWSCYAGATKHCGRCGTCIERVEAFKLAGVADPTEYEESKTAIGN